MLITTVTFLTKFIKSAKGKKTAENILKISGVIEQFIKEAEKFVNYTGAEKKAYVMAQATSFDSNNIILLCHDSHGKQTTVEALPQIIEHYQSLGYTFKALDRDSFVAHHGVNN